MTEKMESIKLTQYAHGGGCGCKIAPGILEKILLNNRTESMHSKLIAGNSGNEDAAVWDLGTGEALVSTTDFFMPVVDKPEDYGAIAAANAISDVYAMGARPIFALAILGWPIEKIPVEVAAQVMKGATEICREAGIVIAGGHTIDSPEPVFGLSVNGLVGIHHLKRNNTARKGDLIFLTKPLGAGIITTASKRGVAPQEHVSEAIGWMKKLNVVGIELASVDGVNAMTDVTGFGLLGHLIEMAVGSRLQALLNGNKIPKMKSVDSYLQQFIYPDMTMKNYAAFKDKCNELSAEILLLLCDPQTSGGLLISADPAHEEEIKRILFNQGCIAEPIGIFADENEKVISVI